MGGGQVTFSDQIRPLVEAVGTAKAAALCGVTPRSLQLWMQGGTPNTATQVGVIVILTKAAKAVKK